MDRLQSFRSRLVSIFSLLRGKPSDRTQLDPLTSELKQGDLVHYSQMRQEIDNAIEMLRIEDRNLKYDTYTNLQQEIRQVIDSEGMNIISAVLQTRQVLACKTYQQNIHGDAGVKTKKVNPEPFSIYLERFKELHPHLYDVWASINFGVSIDVFKNTPETSCAVSSRENARLFRGFIAPYLQGRILDVGCGPYALPYYLEDYPVDLISGIDPLEPFEAHPFEFVRGFAEFLPWEDESFDIVICATTLDHAMSLDLALKEIRRVLKLGGFLLVWDWFGENTKPYNPAEQEPQLIDRYHFFNFSEGWFEELMTENFFIEEKIKLYGNWMHDRYYALRLEKR